MPINNFGYPVHDFFSLFYEEEYKYYYNEKPMNEFSKNLKIIYFKEKNISDNDIITIDKNKPSKETIERKMKIIPDLMNWMIFSTFFISLITLFILFITFII
ncbi:MAG: hypothetical protein ACRCVI_02495 [Mycoplasmoidaceae bacterium]